MQIRPITTAFEGLIAEEAVLASFISVKEETPIEHPQASFFPLSESMFDLPPYDVGPRENFVQSAPLPVLEGCIFEQRPGKRSKSALTEGGHWRHNEAPEDDTDIDALNGLGRARLHSAVLGGKKRAHHSEDLDTLIERGANLEVRTPHGETPLLFAVQYQNMDALKTLLDAGADATATATNGWNALHFLAAGGVGIKAGDCRMVLPIAKKLVDRGVKTDTPATDGLTPIMLAEQNRRPKLAEFLRKNTQPSQ